MTLRSNEPVPFSVPQPGETIQLTDLAQLIQFEDVVAAEVDPNMTPAEAYAWQMRPKLDQYLKPPKFNGRLANIIVKSMLDPLDRLYDAKERGLELHGRANVSRRGESLTRTLEYARGFVVGADASTSGQGFVGRIETELWYLPVTVDSSRGHKESYRYQGMSVQRKIAKPVYDARVFADLQTVAQSVSRIVDAHAMKNPVVQKMSN